MSAKSTSAPKSSARNTTARSSLRRRAATALFTPMARSPSPRPRKPATICKFCPPSQQHRSRMQSPRAAPRYGSSSIRRSAGRLPKAWSSGRRLPARRRLRRTDARDCGSCHGLTDYLSRKPNFTGIDLGGVSSTVVTNLTWDLIKRLRDTVKVKLVLKGILAFEDAKLAADAGIDAIVVSNHGGRVEDGVSATIDVLPEIVGAVGGRMPILVDSGFRRGSDIVKALALGAQAVCIGRPYLWGLGAFGQPGVERVLGILRAETRTAMQQLGAPSLKDLTPAMVRRA